MVQGALSIMLGRHGGGNGYQPWKQGYAIIGYIMLTVNKQGAQARKQRWVWGEGSVGKSVSQF